MEWEIPAGTIAAPTCVRSIHSKLWHAAHSRVAMVYAILSKSGLTLEKWKPVHKACVDAWDDVFRRSYLKVPAALIHWSLKFQDAAKCADTKMLWRLNKLAESAAKTAAT